MTYLSRSVLLGALPPALTALVGSLGSRRAPEVYQRLNRPFWSPPAAAFGPAWSALYVLIGVAGSRMARRGVRRRTWLLHAAQLSLNAAWPATFFSIRDKRASLAVIVALDTLVAAEIADLSGQDPLAAAALGPYLGWSLFATALNAAVSDPANAAP